MNDADPRLERGLRDELEAEQRAAREEMARIDRLLASLPAREGRSWGPDRWRRGAAALAGVAACLVLLAAAFVLVAPKNGVGSPMPGQSSTLTGPVAPSASAIPSPVPSIGTSPFMLEVGSAGGTRKVVVVAPSDCATLSSAWSRAFCELALREPWGAIAGPFDPAGPSGVNAATWQAAMARAAIDGDLSICDDAGMRLVAGYRATGAAPTEAPAAGRGRTGPIAACRKSIAEFVRGGSFAVSDPTDAGVSLTIHVSAEAADRAAAAPTPVPFDPDLACVSMSHSRAYCNGAVAAIERALGGRAASAERVAVVDGDLSCFDGSSCLGPGYGKDPAGGALVDTTDAQHLAFDLDRDVATGEITALEVPVPPALGSPRPSPSPSHTGPVTRDQAIDIARGALPTGGTPSESIVATLGTYGEFVPDPPAKGSPPPADTPVWHVQFGGRGSVQYFAIVDATTGRLISSGVAVTN